MGVYLAFALNKLRNRFELDPAVAAWFITMTMVLCCSNTIKGRGKEKSGHEGEPGVLSHGSAKKTAAKASRIFSTADILPNPFPTGNGSHH